VLNRTFQECEVKNLELREDLYDKMMSLDAAEPTPEEHHRKAVTKLRYMQVAAGRRLTHAYRVAQ